MMRLGVGRVSIRDQCYALVRFRASFDARGSVKYSKHFDWSVWRFACSQIAFVSSRSES